MVAVVSIPTRLRVVKEIQLGLCASFCCPSSTRASAGRACVGPGPIQIPLSWSHRLHFWTIRPAAAT